MLSVIPPPRFKAFDSSGKPLAGGKVYSYSPGTSNPKATYADPQGTAANPNPVVLDSNGEAQIWLSGFYKVVLTDANGIQQWSVDQVSSAPAAATPNGEWVPVSATFTYVSANRFSAPGDMTTVFQTGRRIQCTVSAGTIYGMISAANYSAGITTVTVAWDSGSLDSGLSAVSVGLLAILNPSTNMQVEHNADGTHKNFADVKSFGAKVDGSTDDSTAVQASLNSGAAVVVIPRGAGTCVLNSLITIPAGVTLWLNGGTVTGSGASGIFALTLASNGGSGALVGNGTQSLITYTGTGSAVQAIGTGQSSADLRIAHLRIAGSSAGVSGINLKAFNRGLIEDVEIAGFTAGDGIKNEGANSITVISPNFRNNLNGIHNLTAVVSAVNYAANACRVYGGQIRANSGYGVFEDITGGGGTNIGNGCEGVTFEANGTNVSGTSGNVFLQNATGHQYIGNYFEYVSGTSPTHNITIGDATHIATGTVIMGNWFGSVGATNTINNVNGQTTYIEGNTESASVTNFINNGTLSRGLYAGRNIAAVAANYFTGSDGGADSIIFNDPGLRVNALGSTIRGLGFNVISGLNQDLTIRTRAGGTYNQFWQAIDSTTIGAIDNSGNIIAKGKVFPGTDAGAIQSATGIYAGTGAPNNANGANGDFYFSAAGGALTTIYQKRAGSWVGIV